MYSEQMIHNLHIFKKICRITLFISALAELILFFSLINIYGVLVLTLGWFLIESVVIQPKKMQLHPISSFMLIGLGLFNFISPLPLTLLDYHPVSHKLVIPYITFTHLLLYVIILVFTHSVYCKITKGKNFIRSSLRKTNFFFPLSNFFIWTAAMVGIIFMFLYWTTLWQIDSANKTLSHTIMGSMQTYAIIPAVLLFPKLLQKNTIYNKKNTIYIIALGLVVAIIGIFSNFRTFMYMELMLIIAMLLYSYLWGYIGTFISTKQLFIYIIGIYIAFGPMMDIATAMVYVRGTRTHTNSKDLLINTLDIASNKELLRNIRYKYTSGSQTDYVGEWDERYLDNDFLNRYCNLKINDACLYHASIIGGADPRMQQALFKVFYFIVPRPLLGIFGVSINDKLDAKLSLTDHLYFYSSSYSTFNGGAKIGSIQGIGMSLFGYWYLFIIIPLFYIIFYMYDAMIDIRNGRIIYSIMALIGMLNILNYFNDRHVWTQEMVFILRGYWESIILTCIFIYLINMFINFFYKR